MSKLHMLRSVTDTINTSFILQSDTSTIVIDGGYPTEADYLYAYLKKLGAHVDAWFLTHLHIDHVSAMTKIIEEHSDIRIDRICCHFPSAKWAQEREPKQSTMTSAQLHAWVMDTASAHGVPMVTTHAGEKFDFDGFSVQVLRDPHEEIACGINDTSIVLRITAGDQVLMFLGDLEPAGGRQLLADTDPLLLTADYVQMAHHGQGGVERTVYEAIRPSYCLWCTPTWLWDNRGEGGYDTGPYKTVIVRGWMSEIGGIKRHYLMQEGDHIIEL